MNNKYSTDIPAVINSRMMRFAISHITNNKLILFWFSLNMKNGLIIINYTLFFFLLIRKKIALIDTIIIAVNKKIEVPSPVCTCPADAGSGIF